MIHCKHFLECKERLDRDPESPYYKGGNQYYPSDCAYCYDFEEDVKSENKVNVNNVTLKEYEQLKTMMYDTRKQLQLSLKNRSPKFNKKNDEPTY
jgi:hypothetical protein